MSLVTHAVSPTARKARAGPHWPGFQRPMLRAPNKAAFLCAREFSPESPWSIKAWQQDKTEVLIAERVCTVQRVSFKLEQEFRGLFSGT
jgi:hypothetical protein